MTPTIVEGDILAQDVEVIVNPWNRNLFPWWLLLPQGVSGAIKKKGGYAPFKELRKFGLIPLGGAVETGPGRLPYRSIIHVAGINMSWFATEYSIRESVKNAVNIINTKNYRSAAFPIIGSGSGNRGKEKALSIMLETFSKIDSNADITIVRFIQ